MTPEQRRVIEEWADRLSVYPQDSQWGALQEVLDALIAEDNAKSAPAWRSAYGAWDGERPLIAKAFNLGNDAREKPSSGPSSENT